MTLNQVAEQPVRDLHAHPVNDRIYGATAPSESLVASVRLYGVMEPLVIKGDGAIISGHRRWQAAMEAGLSTVPARTVDYDDDLAERAAINSPW